MLSNKQKNAVNILIVFLFCTIIFLAGYLIISPFYPLLVYKIKNNFRTENKLSDYQNPEINNKLTAKAIKKYELPSEKELIKELPETLNRLIINKIGVDIPIIQSDNSYALEKGTWLIPYGTTPGKNGNTIITGHRFKYLPPNNATFYLLDKLILGDIISVYWNKQTYYYKVKEIKVIKNDDFSVFEPTDKSIITLYTCHPVFSQESRLVVIGELIKKN